MLCFKRTKLLLFFRFCKYFNLLFVYFKKKQYLCTRFRFGALVAERDRKDGGVVDRGGLENR